MATSIAQARAGVEAAFEKVRALADTDEKRPFFTFERDLWTALLALGRALVTLFLARQVARPRPAEYQHDGRPHVVAEERTSELGTRFGKVEFSRPLGRRADYGRGAADLPVDRELGLCGGFSLGVVVAVARLCAQMAFAPARATFKSTYEWAPSPRATLRMVDAVGGEARSFLEQAPPPDDDGDILIIQTDAKGAPMISALEHQRRRRPHRFAHVPGRQARRLRRRAHPRKRRTKGKKSKNAKMAVVGVIYTLKHTPQGLEGPIGKRLYATFESHEALFVWLRREADKRGYGRKPTMFLADGSDTLWRLQQQYFPDAEVCLDWWHVVEKLWAAGECLYPEGSQELTDWMARQTARLRRGATTAILRLLKQELDRIPKTGPGNKGRRQRIEEILNHLRKNQERLNYDVFRQHDLDIGTGVVEGAVRNLVGMRFDGPGMRWSRQRSERLLHLRCILLNGQWDDFVAYLARGAPVTMQAQPLPTETYDAKAAA